MNTKPDDIRTVGLTKLFGRRRAVDAIDLELRRGRITCLLGPSGCGKSTLLRLIAGLEVPDEGQVLAGGREWAGPRAFLPPERRGVGLVFQDYGLFPHLTVVQNVAFGLQRLPRRERLERARALLAEVKLLDHAEAWPHTLSGGEQQRVAIARALAPRPSAVLLDEPFSGLDSHLKAGLRETMITALRTAGAAILLVTHDADDALRMADEMVLMDDGRIIQRGAPRDCYLRPASIAAARMLGDINVLPAAVARGRAITVLGDLPAIGLADGEAHLLVRPDEVRFDEKGVDAELVETRFVGSGFEAMLRIGDQPLRARSDTIPPALGRTRISANRRRVTVIPRSC